MVVFTGGCRGITDCLSAREFEIGWAHLKGWGDLFQIANPDVLSKLAKQEMKMIDYSDLPRDENGVPENSELSFKCYR